MAPLKLEDPGSIWAQDYNAAFSRRLNAIENHLQNSRNHALLRANLKCERHAAAFW